MKPSLIIGHSYWLLNGLNHSYEVCEKDLNAIYPYVLIKIYFVGDKPNKFYFEPKEGSLTNKGPITLDHRFVDKIVFTTKDAFLVYLVDRVHFLNSDKFDVTEQKFSFDSFLKKKINESQDKWPEIWV